MSKYTNPSGMTENLHPQCRFKCQFGHKTEQLDQLVKRADDMVKGMKNMSTALWCDQGEHAFSGNDRKRRRVTETRVDEDGDEIYVTLDICGKCSAEMDKIRAQQREELSRRVLLSSESAE